MNVSSTTAFPAVPPDLSYHWLKLLALAPEELHVRVALISRPGQSGPEIFCRNATECSLFSEASTTVVELALEQQVMDQDQDLYFPDLSAIADDHARSLAASGLKLYHGQPLRWPNGRVFGCLSIYGQDSHSHPETHLALLAEIRYQIEQDLLILVQQEELRTEIARRRQAEAELAQFTPKEFHALWHAAQAVLAHRKFDVAARIIFDEACSMTGARAGYVALLSDDGSENEVMFLEAGGNPCTVDPSLPMPIRGLRAEAYHSGKPAYHNDFMASDWTRFLPEGHVAMRNVMFAPLNIENKTVGIIGLANKDADFTDFDATIAGAMGEVAAIALKNSRNLDLLDQTNQRLEQFNQTLVEREMRIIEVKQEVNRLCRELGREPGYPEISASIGP